MIIAEAEKLGYQPNAIARGLVMGQTNTIGLVIPDITNPFFPEIARGVEDAANELGYNVFLCNTNWNDKKERAYLKILQEKRADGIIITPVSDDDDHYLNELSIPLIYISRAPGGPDKSFVVIDNVRGGFLATKHLIESGYKRIAFIGGKTEVHSNSERLEGYKLALNMYRYKIDESVIVNGTFKSESGYEIIKRLLKTDNPPDGVFAGNDIIALGVLQYVKEYGMDVPGDFGIVGFDDIPFASYPQIKLSTISQPKYLMGKSAAQILINEIKQKDKKETKKIVLEPELVARGTTRAVK
jgi:LacI family transcriptional regulator